MVASFAIFSISFIGCTDSDDYNEEMGIETSDEDLTTRGWEDDLYWTCPECGFSLNQYARAVHCGMCGAIAPEAVYQKYDDMIYELFYGNVNIGAVTELVGIDDRVFIPLCIWNTMTQTREFYNEAIALYDGTLYATSYRKFFVIAWDDLEELIPSNPFVKCDYVIPILEEYIDSKIDNNNTLPQLAGRKEGIINAANTVYKSVAYCVELNKLIHAKNMGK